MNSPHTHPVITSLTSRVTAVRIKAVKTARHAALRPGDPTQNLEAYRALAAIVMLCGYCFQYEASINNSLYTNLTLQIILLNIQNIVSLFFVLAGAIGFLPFARAIVRRQRLYSTWTFLLRRAIRLIPVYYIAILLMWILHFNGGLYQWRDLLEHLTFTQIFDRGDIFQTIEPAWVFAVEIWFYLLLVCLVPLIHVVCSIFRARTTRITILFAISMAFIAGGLLYKLWLLNIPYGATINPVLFYTFPRLDNFGMGMVLAVVIVITETQKQRLILAWLFSLIAVGAGIVTYYVSAYYLSNAIQNLLFCQTMWGIIALFLCLAVIVGMNKYRIKKGKSLLKHVIQYSGLISYEIFIWYSPLFTWLGHYFISSSVLIFSVGLLCFILMTLGVASLTYWLIEYPISFLSYLFTYEGQLSQRYMDLR